MEFYIFGAGETARVMACNLIMKDPDKFLYDDEGFRALTVDPQYYMDPSWLKDLDINPDKIEVIPFTQKKLNPHDLIRGIYIPVIDNKLRETVYNRSLSFSLIPLSFIDKRAMVDNDVCVGAGSWIQAGCTVQTGCEVGEGVIMWANAHVGHKSKIGDFSWITSQACICGGVTLGKRVFVGAGAIIYPGVEVEDDTIIGAGSIITKNASVGTYIAGANKKIA